MEAARAYTRTILLLSLLLSSGSGCSIMGSADSLTRLWNNEDVGTAMQMVPVWSDTVLHQSGEPATRGVGGRVLFYGSERHRSIRTTGSLVVYVWDDSFGTTERSPDRKYVFPAKDLDQHYSSSRLGHSYSFWLPWDAAGGPIAHLTVVTRFVGVEGTELTSSPAHVVLPGPGDGSRFYESLAEQRTLHDANSDIVVKSPRDNWIQQASWSDTDVVPGFPRNGAKSNPAQLPESTEIPLPSGFLTRNLSGISKADAAEVSKADGPRRSIEPSGQFSVSSAEVRDAEVVSIPNSYPRVRETEVLPESPRSSADFQRDRYLAPASAATRPSVGLSLKERFRSRPRFENRLTPADQSPAYQPRPQQPSASLTPQ